MRVLTSFIPLILFGLVSRGALATNPTCSVDDIREIEAQVELETKFQGAKGRTVLIETSEGTSRAVRVSKLEVSQDGSQVRLIAQGLDEALPLSRIRRMSVIDDDLHALAAHAFAGKLDDNMMRLDAQLSNFSEVGFFGENVAERFKDYVRTVHEAMADTEGFKKWMRGLMEEVGSAMKNHRSEKVRAMYVEGRVHELTFQAVLQKRARSQGWGKIARLEKKKAFGGELNGVTGTSDEFFDFVGKGNLFWDLQLAGEFHGRDSHVIQLLYVSSRRPNGEWPAFMRYMGNTKRGREFWTKYFDSDHGNLTEPEKINDLLDLFLPSSR